MEMTESQCDFSEIETGRNEMKRTHVKFPPSFLHVVHPHVWAIQQRERGGGGDTHTHTVKRECGSDGKMSKGVTDHKHNGRKETVRTLTLINTGSYQWQDREREENT